MSGQIFPDFQESQLRTGKAIAERGSYLPTYQHFADISARALWADTSFLGKDNKEGARKFTRTRGYSAWQQSFRRPQNLSQSVACQVRENGI